MCHSKLQDALICKSSTDCFASELYSQGFITHSKYTEVMLQNQSLKCKLLLDAVMNEVKNCPQRFDDFLKLLQEDAAMKTVSMMLDEKRCKITKSPCLFDYTGPLKGEVFDNKCDWYRKAIMSSDWQEVNRLTETIITDERESNDIKAFMLCYQALAIATVPCKLNEAEQKLENSLQLTETIESPNRQLIQGRAYRILAGLPRRLGHYEEGLETVRKGQLALSNAAPSSETSCLLMEEALILQLSQERTPQRQDKIEGLLENALKHARYCKDHKRARYTCSLVYLRKSLFYLDAFESKQTIHPEAINPCKAEECLKNVELNVVGGANIYEIEWYVARSDLFQYRGNTREALKNIRKANDLLEQSKLSDDSYLHVRKRLHKLEELAVRKCIESVV